MTRYWPVLAAIFLIVVVVCTSSLALRVAALEQQNLLQHDINREIVELLEVLLDPSREALKNGAPPIHHAPIVN